MSVLEIILFVIIGMIAVVTMFMTSVNENDIDKLKKELADEEERTRRLYSDLKETKDTLDRAIKKLPKYIIEKEGFVVNVSFYNSPYGYEIRKEIVAEKDTKYEIDDVNDKYKDMQEVEYKNLKLGKKYLRVDIYSGLDCVTKYYYLGDEESETIKDTTVDNIMFTKDDTPSKNVE